MAREMPGYREMLELIDIRYPHRSSLSVEEVAKLLGVHRQTVTAAITRKKNPLPAQYTGDKHKSYIIPIPAFARWQCGGAKA